MNGALSAARRTLHFPQGNKTKEIQLTARSSSTTLLPCICIQTPTLYTGVDGSEDNIQSPLQLTITSP